MKNLRVLITGGLGFIGSNLAQRCVQLGAKVTIYDCLDPRSGGNMHNVHGFEDSVEVVLNDIRNFEGVSASIRHQDILFNCAAYTSHPNSMKEPLIDIDVNCKGVINLLEAARRFNRDLKIVHVGTSSQIGRMRLTSVDENHPEFPLDIYSANKSASEKYVLIYSQAYKIPATVLRFANVFGPRSNIRSPEFGFMNYFTGLALRGKEITVFGKGSQLRTITYVDDCVEALILAAQRRGTDGEVYFATANRQYSVAEIAQQIVTVIGGRLRFVDWPKDREVIEIGDAVVLSTKIEKATGWKAKVDLPSGLAKTREYFTPVLAHYLD